MFDSWIINSGNAFIEDVYAESSILTMPASDAVVTAIFNDISTRTKLVETNDLSVHIYPNPLKDNVLNLELSGFDSSGSVEISLANLLGQTVLCTTRKSAKNIVVHMNEKLKPSGYLVTIKSSQSVFTSKLIVE